ncbi:hypothetical protein B0H17DRAFT_1204767 [Mycena rosella]|uniref:Uncharacterized protein n=1 Tax=Mycena rosella TaxID=1033263 RepID=A0AAD7GFK7_MYCRO|nr:hypothetical protein B0H17DRAFT_1204767 [Mycena rosella]
MPRVFKATQACPPPLTRNALAAEERIRLVRSSRKIQTLLGETPHFLENAPPTFDPGMLKASSLDTSAGNAILHPGGTALRRCAMTTGETPASRGHVHSSSMVQHPARLVGPKSRHSSSTVPPVSRPLLLLRVQTEPKPPQQHFLDAALNLGPSFPELVVAAWSPPTSTGERSKKLDRVARTLGEAVPPELVFPPARGRSLNPIRSVPAPNSPTPKNGGISYNRTSSSIGSYRQRPALDSPTFAPNNPVTARISHNRSSSSLASYRHRPALDSPTFAPNNPLSGYISHNRSSSSIGSVRPRPRVGLPASPRPESTPSPISPSHAVLTSPQGWRGEWNEDMSEVIKRLRELRP